jgi:NTP pyrophosphatase (non-canonical NTP hydrolase)
MRSINDNNITLSYFKEQVNNFIEQRKWKKFHTPKNLIQALGIEAAELSEIFLFKDYSVNEIQKNEELLDSISDEVADIFIYLISLVNSLNLDLSEVFLNKMRKNEEKYSTREFNDGYYQKK